MTQHPETISPETLMSWHQTQHPFVLIDVREPDEYQQANLKGRLIPLASVETQLPKLDTDTTYVIHCKKGIRSDTATALMRAKGFEKTYSLEGGIEAWQTTYGDTCPWTTHTPPTL